MLETMSSMEVISKFRDWYSTNPKPLTCLTDQGRQFTSKEFALFLKGEETSHLVSTAYNPTGNSISERLNQTITRVLQMNRRKPLCEVVGKIHWSLQHTPHRTLGASPYELRYMRSAYDPQQRILNNLLHTANMRSEKQSTTDAERFNSRRKPLILKVSDLVYYKNPIRNKIDPYWLGPYKISKISANRNTMVIGNQGKELSANIKQIRLA